VEFQTKGRSAHVIAMSKSTKHTTPFQRKHVLGFGFKIIKFEDKGNMLVLSGVCCLFYMYHGWDVGPVNRKHKLINNIHIFKVLFIK
jgi:hypothetical protein